MDDASAALDSVDSFLLEAVCGLTSRPDHTAATGLPDIGKVVAERYLLERLIGRGGMGTVYAGRHLVTGSRVAIKLLRGDPDRNGDGAMRMAREARAVGRVHHPNVVAVHDAGFADERPFIAMELLHGESLEQRIGRLGPMSEPEAIDILQQTARGVAAAHASGIIHRDLKPANILLCAAEGGAPDVVKVLDFGISKLHGDGEEDVMVTGHGVQLGTPVFMSPEQVRGEALDECADVYALAVVLYYMLTQRFPFHARSRAELFASILTSEPVPLEAHRPDIAPALAKVVSKGLARDRVHRYASVTALAEAAFRASSAPLQGQGQEHERLSSARVLYLVAALSGFVLPALPQQSPPRQPEVAVIRAPSPLRDSQALKRTGPTGPTGPTGTEPTTIVRAQERVTFSAPEQPPSQAEPAQTRPPARTHHKLGPTKAHIRLPQPRVAPAAADHEDKLAPRIKLMSW